MAVDGAGEVAFQIIVSCFCFEREAAIHDAHLRIAQLPGCLLRGPKEVRARERAHVSDFSRSSVTAMRRTSMNARRSASLIVTLALTVAAIVVGSVPAAAKSSSGAPSASFARLALSDGTHTGTAAGSAGLTPSGQPPTGAHAAPFATRGPQGNPFPSG